jgi:hypothetical protein
VGLGTTHFSVTVEDADHDRNYWASRAGLSPAIVAEIRGADVLLVPWESRAGAAISYPQGTTAFYRSLSSALAQSKVVFAVDPSQYSELALHANEHRWPSIFVSAVLLPAVANILA